MGMRSRAQAALRAWRSSEESAPAISGQVPAGMPIGPAQPSIVAAAGGMSDTSGLTFFNLMGGRGRGAPVGEQDALTVPAVLRALEVLCGLFAMTPFHYYRMDGDEKVRVDDAPQALMFSTSANAVQPAFLLKELMLGDLLMCGRFGGYIHRDTLYRPTALSRLLPGGIVPSQHWDRTDGLEVFYDAQLPDGSRERLTRNDLWFVPGFSRDGLVGLDRLKLLADTFEAASSMNEFAARFWDNNAQPSTVLTTKAKVAPEEKLRIRNDWSQRFSGPRNAGATAVLDQEMKAEFLSHNNEEAQFIETRGFSVVEVSRAFGVPPHVLFELSRATFSNIEHQSLELYLYTMLGHFGRSQAHMTHAFAEPGHFFEANPDALLKGDIKSRYEAYSVAIDKGILNPDEVRSLENRNKRAGGEKYRVGSGSQIEGETPRAPASTAPAPPKNEEVA